PSERNPLKASSLGLGELLVAAYDEGCTRFVVGLGGTATCDGGAGMLRAPGIERLRGTHIELLCDVEAPFVGPHGAARVFAPQKGASPEDVEVLEKRMLAQAYALQVRTGVDVSALPGAGAAGGLAGALLSCFGATIHPGIDRVLDLVHFDDALLGASLIITGEGKSDAQTLMGKVPMGVLRHAGARAGAVPVALLSGRIEERSALERADFHPVVEVTPRLLPLQEALDPRIAVQNLHQAVLEMPFQLDS
ncbi:MAG TPA: glycerate kinase, partial [Rikenellaceae bacterium]|nr:glycerate kinase [Rikenellaceae bacterium]